MSYLSIALSGLTAARQGMTIVGDNISNIATQGYHRQEAIFASQGSFANDWSRVAFGVTLTSVRRIIDRLVEDAIIAGASVAEKSGREAEILRIVESVIGEPGDGGLSALLADFFSAWDALSLDPASQSLRQSVLHSGMLLSSRFNFLNTSITGLRSGLMNDVDQITQEINTFSSRIAELNTQIRAAESAGGTSNHLRDERASLLTQLSERIDIQLTYRDLGAIDVRTRDVTLVSGGTAFPLYSAQTAGGGAEVRLGDNRGPLLLSPGGRLGAVLSLQNDLLPGILDDFDRLARELILAVNRTHASGVGSAGSFTALTGRAVTADLADLVPPVTAGTLYIRVTDLASGQATRYAVDVDPASDDLASIAAKIDALTGLDSFVAADRLNINAESNYTFDFLPTLDPTPDPSAITGSARPSVSGFYTGSANELYTFTVSGSGEIGLADDLSIEVRNGAAELVAVVRVGLGYPPGTAVPAVDGTELALSSGSLNDGDTFTLDALASTDTASVLSALGLNTFFDGTSASSIRVSPGIEADPSMIAASLDPAPGDNANAQRIAAIMSATFDDLDVQRLGEFAGNIATGVGQLIFLKENQKAAEEIFLADLARQRDEDSGVDLDAEALKLLEFQRMYEGVAKYLAVADRAMQSLLEILQ